MDDVKFKRNAYSPLGALTSGSGATVTRSKGGEVHEPEHYTMFYVDVEDVQAALDQAVKLGGNTLVGPIAIPTGTFAWFADPDGNTIGLLKSASHWAVWAAVSRRAWRAPIATSGMRVRAPQRGLRA